MLEQATEGSSLNMTSSRLQEAFRQCSLICFSVCLFVRFLILQSSDWSLPALMANDCALQR